MAATVAAVTAVDLTIKYLVAAWIPPREQRGLLAPVTNPEFSLGIAGGHHVVMVALMTLGVVAALAVAIPLVTRGRVPPSAAGLTIGGAVANTVDRALNGTVQDYLVVGHVVLNLADAAVVIGMAITAYTLLRTRTLISHTDTRSCRATTQHPGNRRPSTTRSADSSRTGSANLTTAHTGSSSGRDRSR